MWHLTYFSSWRHPVFVDPMAFLLGVYCTVDVFMGFVMGAGLLSQRGFEVKKVLLAWSMKADYTYTFIKAAPFWPTWQPSIMLPVVLSWPLLMIPNTVITTKYSLHMLTTWIDCLINSFKGRVSECMARYISPLHCTGCGMWMDGWMSGVLGHFVALLRLNCAGDNLQGYWDELYRMWCESSAQNVGWVCDLSKDIGCHVLPYFSKLANHQIRPPGWLSAWWLHMHGHFAQNVGWVCVFSKGIRCHV